MSRLFRDKVLRLKRNLHSTGFTAEAMRLERRITEPAQLSQVGRPAGVRAPELRGYPIQENERDLVIITLIPTLSIFERALAPELWPNGPPYSLHTLQKFEETNQAILQAHVHRYKSKAVLLCDELMTYASKARKNGKLARHKSRTSSHQATSIRFPITVHDLLRELPGSISDNVVSMCEDSLRKLGKLDG
tara:strand:+ start:4213 stop:4785 length:573 start_codon:yes stop_codon:yes gene_type:complete